MINPDFSEECPQNPSERTCGLAAARYLIKNELIYIDVEPTDVMDRALDASIDEVPGVQWDNVATKDSLELVDQAGVDETSMPFANATFGCLACSKWVRVALEPFDTFTIEFVEP